MLKQLLKNRVFVVGFLVCVLCVVGLLLYALHEGREEERARAETPKPRGKILASQRVVPPFEEQLLTGEPPASIVDAPLPEPPPKTALDPEKRDRLIREAINRDINFAQAGRFDALRQILDEAVENGEFPREKRWTQLRIILKEAVSNGQISSEESTDIRQRYRAMLKTEGMSAWEAAQYFNRHGSPSMAYTKELAAQALAADPDDPERLYFWSTQQDYVSQGPNPEREAAYAKIVAMEGIPPKERASYLNVIGGNIWRYKPEEAIRYMQEAEALTGEPYYALGHAYQRLGQYHKALAVYRRDYAHYPTAVADKHIRAILNGTPLYRSIHKARQEKAAEMGTRTPPPAVSRTEDVPFDTPDTEFPTRSEGEADATPVSDPDTEHARAADAARTEYQRMTAERAEQAETFAEFIRTEFPELREYIDLPPELKALKSLTQQNLEGTPAAADPHRKPISQERIRTAMQTIQAYGREDGLRRLRNSDPDVAREIENRLNNSETENR